METIESVEIVGHVTEFLAQVLAPMMRSGEIASIDAVCTGESRNAPRVHGYLEEELEYLVFTRSMNAKKRSKILE